MNAQAELDESVRRHDMFLSARLGGQRALLANRDLSGLNLADKRLNDADLTAAFLPAARMAGANLAKSTLFTLQPDAGGFARSSADARRSARRGAARANREGADLFDADLREGRLGQRLCMGVIEEVAVEHAASSDLEGARMVNADPSQAKLSGALAAHTDFTDAVIRRCKRVRADLHNATLHGANLDGADLSCANLQGASLRNAILTDVVFHRAEMDGTDLAGVLTQKPGRRFAALGAPVQELLRRHERWAATHGAEGAPLDLSF